MKTQGDEVSASTGLRAHLLGLLAGAGMIIGLTLLMLWLIRHWPSP